VPTDVFILKLLNNIEKPFSFFCRPEGFFCPVMKKGVLGILLLLLLSCTPEVIVGPEVRPPITPQEYRVALTCKEFTKKYFNKIGLDVLPFTRLVFFDIDDDGNQDMITGSKDGLLRLYKNSGNFNNQKWDLVEGYFDNISVNAFSSPAVGDIDLDGTFEVLVGSGGFSDKSGRIAIYRNTGTALHPVWVKIDLPEMNVGNDATPTLFDIDRDGRLDIIAGNSSGNLFLFRNTSEDPQITFTEEQGYFRGLDLGMYTVPAVTSMDDTVVLVVGNSEGNLYVLEKRPLHQAFRLVNTLPFSLSSFASPAFILHADSIRKDMVIADGKGHLHYFNNELNNVSQWTKVPDFFDGRISPGPASAPSTITLNGMSYMIVGNISGDLRLFRHDRSSQGLPWVEILGHFRKIHLSGFSKGVVTVFQNKELLITGQQNGALKAFLNFGTMEYPLWTEQTRFFSRLSNIPHAAPAVFDLNNDGRWELIVGDARGYVNAFQYRITKDGQMEWIRLDNSFRNAKVKQYATPTLFHDRDNIIMVVGQQDGRLSIFSAKKQGKAFPVFQQKGYIDSIQVNNHSVPSAFTESGEIMIIVGDYDGNLKNFACVKERNH
jgi:hypothetical protein